MNCDTLLMVGTSFPYTEFLPKEGQARGVQIDLKPKMLNLRYPIEVPLHGDAKLTLRELLPMLEEKQDRGWRQQIEEWVADWWQTLEGRAYYEADPINPQRVFWELSPKLPENCIVASDSGSAANWLMRDLRMRPPMMASNSGGLATMCPGVPYVLAAKFTHPERPAIAMVGDGAMQMLGNNALISIGSYWREWADPRLIIGVLNNGDLNQVTWEQRVLAGDPEFEASQPVPDFNYARYAESLGLKGIRVETPDAIAPAWDAALAAARPTVVEFVTDPDVPPTPPHITFNQARSYLHAMVEGDPDTLGMAKLSWKDVLQSWLPRASM